MTSAYGMTLDDYDEMVLDFISGSGLSTSLPPLMRNIALSLAERGLLEDNGSGWRVTSYGRQMLGVVRGEARASA